MLYERERPLYYLFGFTALVVALAGFIYQGFLDTLKGLAILQLHPSRLLNDFTAVGGAGAALVNSAVVASVGLFFIRATKVRLSGPTIAAFFTMMGFGLFGKTPLNILPIIFGVFLAAKLARITFSEYILIALFGTAVGPITTFMITEAGISGLPAYFAGAGIGVVTGMLLPSIAITMLGLHKGYNLYNVGLTCGFIALFAAAVFKAAGLDLTLGGVWNSKNIPVLKFFIPLLSGLLFISGLIIGKKHSFSSLVKILKMPGRLPSDFFTMASPAGGLLNMGLLGILAWGFVLAVGGDFNGPVLGGILTIIGFGAFGKHIRNTPPIIAGVVIACLVFGKTVSAPGPILAALFATTLAPVTGEFGIFAGAVVGFVHLTMVEQTAAWHGGINLYNNGFAGGLTAALFIAVIEWFPSKKRTGHEEKRKGKS